MSMVMCDCGKHIDSDYDVECFMVDDTVACESCRCQMCGERKAEKGYENCKYCEVEWLEANPEEIVGYFDQAEIARFISEVHAERNRVLGRALGDGFMQKRQAQ